METQPAAHAGTTRDHPAVSDNANPAHQHAPAPDVPDCPRVLVVEPDDDIRLTLLFTLTAQGWDVIEADCMAAANWAVREHHPTVVLTELVLSGQESTGLLFINALHGYDPQLPVVVLTTLIITTERRRRTMTAGAREVIGKPFDRDQLVALLAGCHRAATGAAGVATGTVGGLPDADGAGRDWAAVGRVIGQRRRALGLPKNEAARRAQVSNTTWPLLEAGRSRNPSHETIVRVAKVIAIDPDALLHAGSHDQPPPNESPPNESPLAVATIDPQAATADTAEGEARGDAGRSEERRVGKECRSRWSPYH